MLASKLIRASRTSCTFLLAQTSSNYNYPHDLTLICSVLDMGKNAVWWCVLVPDFLSFFTRVIVSGVRAIGTMRAAVLQPNSASLSVETLVRLSSCVFGSCVRVSVYVFV